MFAEQNTLITIIKNAIATYHEQVESIVEQNNSSLERYQSKIRLLEDDINNITQIPLEEIAEVLSDVPLTDEERELEFNYLKSIKGLLELNQTKKTTFQLSSRQIAYMEELKRQLHELEKIALENKKDDLESASHITDKIKKLNTILGLLEDEKNKEFISDVPTILTLLEEQEIDPSHQRAILYGILRYNQSKYEDKLSSGITPEMERLNKEDVKELFEKYSYNFEELKENLQEDIISYGNLKQMEEVFECLKEMNFPRLDPKRNGTKLVAILINGDSHVIKDVVEYSKSKGITPNNLLMIIPAIIEQAPKKKTVQRTNPTSRNENTPWISGKSEDFKKNIEFFENIGFNIDYILNKCKELLVMSNERLVSNYRQFIQYGFTIKTDEFGELTCPALSCLLSTNFSEIVDQFIEICRDGHQYIKDNMSRIASISDAHDIVFYNIYASNMNQNNVGDDMIPEGPFIQNNSKKLRLRGEITRYAGSGFENISYREITEENKKEKTMTIEIDCQNKKDFDDSVEAARGREGELYNLVFNDSRILELDEYTDINDPVRYDFDGILISKQKVARIFNILKNAGLDTLEDSLLYAITYNSIMNQEAFDKIKKIIKDRRK